MNKKIIIIMAAFFLIASIVFILFLERRGNRILKIGKSESSSPSSLLQQARDFEAKSDLLKAKSVYQKLINEFADSAEFTNWQKKIEGLNIKLLFSPAIIPGSILYEIKAGDSLTKIAREFKTTVELIKKSNNISDDKILPRRKLKVWTALFSLVIDKSQNTLILKTNEEIIKTYIVSTGVNSSTPIGNFKIINKLPNPTWFKAGAVVPANSPENILGSRWLGFDLPGYGIHGTTDPQSLGKQVTQGCVRMSNSDVEELYIILPIGTEVTIVN